MNKKKIGIIIITMIILIVVGCVGFYFYGLMPVNKIEDVITYQLKSGTSKLQLADDLKSKGLVRSSLVLKIYLFLHQDLNLQAGTYELTDSMKPQDILEKMDNGNVKNDTISITLVEGKRANEYIKTISEKLEITEEELTNQMHDEQYLASLIEKYWFLENDILKEELYVPLEGYLFPDTYELKEKSTASEIIEKILNHTAQKLEPLKEQIENSDYNVHEILSMASIIELEAVTENDRNTVSQVIHKRLAMGKGLGMDVTTYYAVKKEMGSNLTLTDLKTVSPYNTSELNSSMAGKLPIGAICNPSLMSIQAVLNPTDTDYLYFYADIKTGMVYFTRTYEEHLQVQKEVG